jgi:hydrogenase 3 maturation protease
VVILGVGSELRSDDAVGLHVARSLSSVNLPGVHAMDAGPAPENLTADLRALSPRVVVIVDAASMAEPPGTVRLIDPSNVGGASFGTHGLPLTVLADYLRRETGCAVHILGIQPATVAYGEELSPEVAASAQSVVETLEAALR